MSMRFEWSVPLYGLLALLMAGAPAYADKDYRSRDSMRGLSLDEAVNQLQNSTGGRVISAESKKNNGDVEHRIRILTPDGRVKRFRLEGEPGNRMRGDDRPKQQYRR